MVKSTLGVVDDDAEDEEEEGGVGKEEDEHGKEGTEGRGSR